LGEKLEDLKNDIYALKKINFELYTEELMTIIESDPENIIGPAVDIEPVVRELLTTTVEAEVMTMVRSLAMDVKRAQGYAVYNRGGDDLVEKTVDRETLRQKLEAVRVMVDSEDFDIGAENLNRYIKTSLKKLLEELE
jgi:negative regulator of replication initiation